MWVRLIDRSGWDGAGSLTLPPNAIYTLSHALSEEEQASSKAAPAAASSKADGFKGFGEKPEKAAPPPKTKAQLEVRVQVCVSVCAGGKSEPPE